jgi:glycosyltransferase involved in cell wall biosynthesis
MNKISVIIPSYNSSLTIGQTIKTLLSQSQRDLISEIIIVDSSQDKTTPKLLSEYESEVKIIRLSSKAYPSVARNIGVSASSGEILVFFDADVYPDDLCFKKIIDAYNNGCMVGGGSIAIPSFQKGKVIPLAQYYLQFNEYIPFGKSREKKFVPSCNMFCDKELFKKIGGFPEIRASEDVLFGLNANKITKVWFIPDAKVYHIFRENLKCFLKNQILLGEHIIYYRKIYYKSFVYNGVFPIFLFPFILIFKLSRIIYRIFNSGYYHIRNFLKSSPLFLLGLIFWSYGFIKGSINYKEFNTIKIKLNDNHL